MCNFYDFTDAGSLRVSSTYVIEELAHTVRAPTPSAGATVRLAGPQAVAMSAVLDALPADQAEGFACYGTPFPQSEQPPVAITSIFTPADVGLPVIRRPEPGSAADSEPLDNAAEQRVRSRGELTSQLEQLLQLAPPPRDRTGYDWSSTHEALGRAVPPSFRNLVDIYGDVLFANTFRLFHPSEYPWVDLATNTSHFFDRLQPPAAGWAPDVLPAQMELNSDSLIVWGGADNGDFHAWHVTGPDPELWPVMLLSHHLRTWYRYSGTVTELVLRWLTRDLTALDIPAYWDLDQRMRDETPHCQFGPYYPDGTPLAMIVLDQPSGSDSAHRTLDDPEAVLSFDRVRVPTSSGLPPAVSAASRELTQARNMLNNIELEDAESTTPDDSDVIAAPAAEATDSEDVAERSVSARTAAWAQWGTVDDCVMGNLVNPSFMGGPQWPDFGQAFRMVRRPGEFLIASDGLSDPFGEDLLGIGDDASSRLNGFGCELFASTMDPIDGIGEVAGSWLMSLVWQISQYAAERMELAALLEELTFLSSELYNVNGPDSHADRFVNDSQRVGVLLGLEDSDAPSMVHGPLSSIRLINAKLLTRSELELVLEHGDEGREELARRFAVQGNLLTSSLDRPSVV